MCKASIDNKVEFFSGLGFILGNVKLSFDNGKKIVKKISSWKNLNNSEKINGENFFIITGSRSGITAFDVDIKNDINGEDNLMIETELDFNDYLDDCIKVKTQSGGFHYIFNYDKRFKSGTNCFDIKGFDIRNDNAILYAGERYEIVSVGKNFMKSNPVSVDTIYEKLSAISSEVFETKPINQKYYELINILPNEYFNQFDKWVLSLYALKNSKDVDIDEGLNTIIKLLNERSTNPNEEEAIRIYNLDNSKKRFNIGSIINILKKDSETKQLYQAWNDKWNPKKEEEQKKTLLELLKEKLLEMCADTYKREKGTGAIYEKQLSYYYVRKYADPKEFLNEIFEHEELFTKHCTSSVHQEMIYFIKNIINPEFPFMEINHDYIGFNNGAYCLSNAEFIDSDNVPENIQVRTLIPIDYVIKDAPMLDKYFKYQFDDETIEFIYFMVGRLLTKIDDRFDFMIYLFGEGGTGKSLLMNLIKYSFGTNQIGILSNSHQEKFGLSEFAKKQILCCDDMNNLAKTLPKADFLSMCTRGSVQCPVKGKESIEIHDWSIPTIINSNYLPNYTDKAGEVIRRLMILNFENAIIKEDQNTQLEYNIKDNEFPMFLHRSRTKYLEFYNKYGNKNIESFCPNSFIENRNILREESNTSYMFAKDKLYYVEGSRLTVKQLNGALKEYLKEKYDIKHMPKDKINIPNILLTNEQYIQKRINVCKSCRKDHLKGCCKDYNRTNVSKSAFIENVAIRYETLNFE